MTATLSCLAIALLGLAGPALAQDTKRAADQIMHRVRSFQNEDGSYGTGLATTCRVLDLLSRSPRRYNELDGPFFRVAARQVASSRDESRDFDALRALALAGCITGTLSEARELALDRLASGPDPAPWTVLLALASLRPDGPLPPATNPRDPGVRCLLAEDPASIAPPDASDLPSWNRWARAARLRGLRPARLPPLPQPPPDAKLPNLLEALETVILCHGLIQRSAGPAEPEGLPGLVGPGQTLDAALGQAWVFLEAHQSDGTFGLDLPGWSGPEPGITALNLSATIWIADRLDRPRPAWVGKGLDYLGRLQREDGSILQLGLAVYTTSVAIEALLDGGRLQDGPIVERARQFLVAAQADEGEGYSQSEDPHYGGIGYGGDERPDLSNTQMALEAARRAGIPAEHVFYQRAQTFLEKCQNLGEQRHFQWPRKGGGLLVSGNDGGATYMPGNSPAGETRVDEGIYQARSYGSMTYALTKSYLLCGRSPDDPCVTAAIGWLAEHFTVEHNPGFDPPERGADGLYYYYLAMARTLRLVPADSFDDASGQPIAWRARLRSHLLEQQRTDGSWVNIHSPRWWEGAPTLCTAYALLTLKACEG